MPLIGRPYGDLPGFLFGLNVDGPSLIGILVFQVFFNPVTCVFTGFLPSFTESCD